MTPTNITRKSNTSKINLTENVKGIFWTQFLYNGNKTKRHTYLI